jgi:hypothetical protein
MPSRKQRAVTGVPPERWEQLGKALQAWREDVLGYKSRTAFARERLPLTEEGNPNVRLIQDLEHSYRPGTYTKWSLEDAEKAYEITHESVLAFLRGEADTLDRAPAAAAGEPAAAIGVPPLPPSPFDNPVRTEADRPYAVAIWKRFLDLPRSVTEPTGAQMFGGGTDDARAWHGFGARLPLGDRGWFIADMQRREESSPGGRSGNSGTGVTGA